MRTEINAYIEMMTEAKKQEKVMAVVMNPPYQNKVSDVIKWFKNDFMKQHKSVEMVGKPLDTKNDFEITIKADPKDLKNIEKEFELYDESVSNKLSEA
jgi:uncharacterized protein (DUF1919 family)